MCENVEKGGRGLVLGVDSTRRWGAGERVAVTANLTSVALAPFQRELWPFSILAQCQGHCQDPAKEIPRLSMARRRQIHSVGGLAM